MEQETKEQLRAMGVHIPTGAVARSASWDTYLTGDERLADMLAAEWMAERVARIPAGAPRADYVRVAESAVRIGRKRAQDWSEYAAEVSGLAIENAQWIPTADMAMRALDIPAAGRAARLAGTAEDWPTAERVMAASYAPMSAPRWSMRLEHAGSQYLQMFDTPSTRPDVWSRRHGSHVARPDRVAFKGVARYELPQPCQYGRCGAQPAAMIGAPAVRVDDAPGWGVMFDDADAMEWRTWQVVELLTMTHREATKWNRNTGEGTAFTYRGWRGHRAIEWETTPRKSRKRAAAKVKRAQAGAVGKRGPAVGPWSLAPRSLPAAVASRGVAEQVVAIEALLRSASPLDLIAIGAVSVSVTGPAEVIDASGRAYPIREWARRAALSGVAIA
jgi:hypothetical protein